MEENYKIICFVHNELNCYQGLYHAFSERTFDSNTFISQFIYEIMDDVLTPKFGQGEGIRDKFLLITNNQKPITKPNLSDNDDWDILLVSHDKNITEIPDKFLSKDVLLMYHKNQQNIEIIRNNQFVKKAKQGQHEPLEAQGYNRLLKLNQVWIGGEIDQEKYAEAKQDIINWFGINDELEAKLELLHKCLLPSSAPKQEEFDKDFKILKKDYGDDYTLFLTSINGNKDDDVFNTDYIKALTKLRNALLGS